MNNLSKSRKCFPAFRSHCPRESYLRTVGRRFLSNQIIWETRLRLLVFSRRVQMLVFLLDSLDLWSLQLIRSSDAMDRNSMWTTLRWSLLSLAPADRLWEIVTSMAILSGTRIAGANPKGDQWPRNLEEVVLQKPKREILIIIWHPWVPLAWPHLTE